MSCEDSLQNLPGLQPQEVPISQEAIVLDSIENAKGLEQLFVVCLGLDAPIGGEQDATTRSYLYQGITRAQLMAVVINEFLPDGWLAFLGCLELKDGENFDKSAAFAETQTDAAGAVLKAASSVGQSGGVVISISDTQKMGFQRTSRHLVISSHV